MRNFKHGGYAKKALDKAARGDLDGRTRLAKAARDLRGALTRDLGDELSTQQELLVTRVIAKHLRLNAAEAAMAAGAGNERLAEFYISLANSLRLDLMALGLERKAKNITTLKDYIEVKR